MPVGRSFSYCVTILLKLIIIAVYVFSIAYVHLRGNVRHKLGRQLSDHSTFLAPLNCFLYLFSKVPSQPYLKPADFPQLQVLQDHWQEIREEARNLMQAGEIKRSEQPNDVGFNSFFKSGWKRFYLKWFGDNQFRAGRQFGKHRRLDRPDAVKQFNRAWAQFHG